MNIDVKMLLQINLKAVCVRVSFSIALNLAVDTLRGTSSIDQIIRRFFSI